MTQLLSKAGLQAIELHTDLAKLIGEFSDETEKVGLGHFSISRVVVLDAISRGVTRVTDLSEELGTTQQATGKLLRSMKRERLLSIGAEHSDKRARSVGLMDRGRYMLRIWSDHCDMKPHLLGVAA